jgi:hypothetical protein
MPASSAPPASSGETSSLVIRSAFHWTASMTGWVLKVERTAKPVVASYSKRSPPRVQIRGGIRLNQVSVA